MSRAAFCEAAKEVGLRLTLLRTAYVRAGWQKDPNPGQARFLTPDVDKFLADTDTMIAEGARVGVAPHSVRAVPIDYVKTVAEYARARSVPLHMHVSEQPAEVEASVAEYGRRPVELLHDHGVLGDGFTAVHAIHITDEEARMLGRSTVCACPTSERNLGDGAVPADKLFAAGARIGFGSDSNVQIDILEDARELEYHLRMNKLERSLVETSRLFASATESGARSLGSPGGALEAGRAADFFTIDLNDCSVAGASRDSLLAHVVFSLEKTAIRDVCVAGELVRPAAVILCRKKSSATSERCSAVYGSDRYSAGSGGDSLGVADVERSGDRVRAEASGGMEHQAIPLPRSGGRGEDQPRRDHEAWRRRTGVRLPHRYGSLRPGVGRSRSSRDSRREIVRTRQLRLKGYLACVLAAVAKVEATKPLAIVLTADEEVGCVGAKFLAQKKVLRAKRMVIGEPTGLRPVSAGKGYALAEIVVCGKEAHSAFPAHGRSAIYDAARVVTALERVAKKLESRKNPSLRSALHDAQRRSDSRRHSEEHCSRRMPDHGRMAAGPRSARRLGRELIREALAGLRVDATFDVKRLDPAFAPSVTKHLVTTMESISGRRATTVSFGTEAAHLSALTSEVIVFGPGDMTVAHKSANLCQSKP